MSEYLGYNKPPKTEADISGQIDEISGKMLERARELPDSVGLSSIGDGSLDELRISSGDRLVHLKGSLAVVGPKVEDTVTSLTHRATGEPHTTINVLAKENISGNEDGTQDTKSLNVWSKTNSLKHEGEVEGDYRKLDGVRNGVEAGLEHRDLSKTQSIHAAAGILGHLRGQIAKRENVVKKQKDDEIDALLKS